MTKIIYDTTLRDGLQARGAHMTLSDKLKTFQDLDSLRVPIIEVCWPSSPKEDPKIFDKCRSIRKQAKITAFGSTSISKDPTKDSNLAAILNSKADYACIFGKSWLSHVHSQLKTTPDENLKRISNSIKFLLEHKMPVIYDAEHFFDGYKDNPNYAISTIEYASNAGAEFLVLCDTNGGTLLHEVKEIVKKTKESLNQKSIKTPLGSHFHNDSGLAAANALYTADYFEMIQGTANGMGERVGNLNWTTFAINWVYKMGNYLDINWKNLTKTTEEIFRRSGLPVQANLPYLGRDAFSHKGGVHIDALNKGASYEHINPEIFGNERILLLTTQGGRGNIIKLANKSGCNFNKNDISFKKKAEKLFKKLKQLEDDGYRIEALPAEQFLLIEEHFGNLRDYFKLGDVKVTTAFNSTLEESTSFIRGNLEKKILEKKLTVEGGPVHAIYELLTKMLSNPYPQLNNLKIVDYHVDLARYQGVKSSVRTAITFSDGLCFTTVGVSDNIIRSAVEAIEKGFRYYLNRQNSQTIKGMKER